MCRSIIVSLIFRSRDCFDLVPTAALAVDENNRLGCASLEEQKKDAQFLEYSPRRPNRTYNPLATKRKYRAHLFQSLSEYLLPPTEFVDRFRTVWATEKRGPRVSGTELVENGVREYLLGEGARSVNRLLR